MNSRVLIVVLLSILSFSCEKEPRPNAESLSEFPLLSTIDARDITQTRASAGGKIELLSKSQIKHVGVCWSTTNQLPTITDTKSEINYSAETFTINLTSLAPGTTYFFRAYATNSAGVTYGKVKSFLTNSTALATITTDLLESVSNSTMKAYGTILNNGFSTISKYGFCWSKDSSLPDISNAQKSVLSGKQSGTFTEVISSLVPNSKYYVRAYATNDVGTAYGEVRDIYTNKTTVPIASTISVNNISSVAALVRGQIVSNGNSPITSYGVCWSENVSPDLTNTILKTTSVGDFKGNFETQITQLSPNTTYYTRTYAINSEGIGYGNVISFKTSAITVPAVKTLSISDIYSTTAVGKGEITSNGNSPVTTYGFCWSTSSALPSTNDAKTATSGNKIGVFTEALNSLKAGTTYWVRAYATNAFGTSYGDAIGFMTTNNYKIPTVATINITNITSTSASAIGSITDNGNRPIISSGFCWSTSTSNPTIANSKTTSNGDFLGSFQTNLTLLSPNRLYYVRAYATNDQGTAYGITLSFTTPNNISLPIVSTNGVYNATNNSILAEGYISSNGNTSITSYGFCYSFSNSTPTISNSKISIIGNFTGTYSQLISSLVSGTKYYLRAYATNSQGTAYGNTLTFTTSQNYAVGNSGPGGGMIFYDKGDYTGGWRYMEITTQDLGSYPWGCSSTFITGTSPALGEGKANTTKILNSCGSSNIAASVCENLSQNGYSDWYLPSYYELDLVYIKLKVPGLSSFSSSSYWTSTQYDTSQAYGFNFSTNKFSNFSKSSTYRVRAIRFF